MTALTQHKLLAPLGHALSSLSMASVYDAWIDKITNLRTQMREYDQVAATIRQAAPMGAGNSETVAVSPRTPATRPVTPTG